MGNKLKSQDPMMPQGSQQQVTFRQADAPDPVPASRARLGCRENNPDEAILLENLIRFLQAVIRAK